VHSLVLRFECKDILRALRPRFAVVWVDVCHDVGNPVSVVTDCFRAAIKVASAVVLPVEVSFLFKSIVAVEGDDELNAIASRVVHEVVESVQDFIVPGLRSITLETGEAVYRGAFLGRCLTCDLLAQSCPFDARV
jgi:hypothetical protein